MANALILNLPGGRLTIGPADPRAASLPLKLEVAGDVFFARQAALSRRHAAQVEQFIGLWLDPPPAMADIDAERRVLSAALRMPKVYEVLSIELREEHFGDPIHGRVWAAIGALWSLGEPWGVEDILTVIEPAGSLDEVGGVSYLNEVSEIGCSAIDAAISARRIIERHDDRTSQPVPWGRD